MAKQRQINFYEDDHQTIRTTVTIIEEADGTTCFICADGYTMYPMELDGIEPNMYKSYGFDPALIRPWKVGCKTRMAYLVPVRDIEYNALIADEKAEQKREERKSKCLVAGKNGYPIICRETSCWKAYEEGRCTCYGNLNNVTADDVYLEDMMTDTNWEPSTDDTTSGTAMAHVMEDEFKEYLAHHQKKLRTIYEDNICGLDAAKIAAKHGYNINTTYRYLKKIKKLADEFFNQD